ncbi:MAG: uroporphyrinogen-III C-methyltransferase [Bacteroidia bacterium]|nr:uroporphyrinogen-III C-methyltransferase [Bacteroidia bacterium]
MKTIIPRISLVGAGPGDPDLITVKGLKAIHSADVVLYDALVTDEIINEAPEQALKIYVGKRFNNHRYSQDEINLLIVQMAFSHGHVVRLKGGDPFIFGRGHEELEYARSFDIPVAVIPGISSSIAVPELQHVPLTRRGVNESFWVITGTTSSGAISADMELAAQSSATIVILMGMRKIEAIASTFSKYGKSQTAALVIQNGSRDNERHVIGKVSDIAEKVSDEGLGAPGIIVIGNVVELHPDIQQLARVHIQK